MDGHQSTYLHASIDLVWPKFSKYDYFFVSLHCINLTIKNSFNECFFQKNQPIFLLNELRIWLNINVKSYSTNKFSLLLINKLLRVNIFHNIFTFLSLCNCINLEIKNSFKEIFVENMHERIHNCYFCRQSIYFILLLNFIILKNNIVFLTFIKNIIFFKMVVSIINQS